jgi:hypothetical protein
VSVRDMIEMPEADDWFLVASASSLDGLTAPQASRDRPGWRLVVAPSAPRGLERLPEKAAAAIVEFILGPLTGDPHRVAAEAG